MLFQSQKMFSMLRIRIFETYSQVWKCSQCYESVFLSLLTMLSYIFGVPLFDSLNHIGLRTTKTTWLVWNFDLDLDDKSTKYLFNRMTRFHHVRKLE